MTEQELALELAKLIVPMHISDKSTIATNAETAMECYLDCLNQIRLNSKSLDF